MKKILTLLFALVMVSEGFSQVYENWYFGNRTAAGFPAGFVLWSLDGQSLNSQSGLPASLATNWAMFDSSGNGSGFAACASYFANTSVAANRWLVTASFVVPTGVPNVCLKWSALSDESSESYNVLLGMGTDSSTSNFTTTLAAINGENTSLTTHIAPLAQWAGDTVRIAFQDVSLNQFVLILTSIQVVNVPSYSAQIDDVEIYEHNYIGNAVPVTGIMSNNGFDTINSFTLNYSVNGAAPVTSAATGAGLLPQESYYYTHSIPFNPSTAGTYTIQVWFSQMNGTAASSDTSSISIFYYPQVSGLTKNVVVEEMTGAGCPWCPGGGLALRDVHNNLPYVIPVAIHSADINDLGVTPADAMQIADGETVCNYYATGFPSGMVDRLYSFDNQTIAPSFWNNYYEGPSTVNSLIWDTLAVFRHENATPVNVSLSALSYDTTSGSVSVTVNATFLNGLSQGAYNLNLYVIEDSLLITGNGYDQDNGAYSSAAGQTTNYNELYSLPAVLIDNGQVGEWSQNHVLRSMVGGPWGTTGIIPSAPAQGTTYSNTYTTVLDPTWRPKYIYLAGLVQEDNANINLRTILNAAQIPLIANTTGIKPTSELNSLSVYPNPVSDMAKVEIDLKSDAMVTISVVDALGQVAIAPSNSLLNAGGHTVNIPVSGLSTGLYLVKVSVNGEVSTTPLSVVGK